MAVLVSYVMPTQKTAVAYEIIVSQNGDQSVKTAIANASAYLSYADTTDNIGLYSDTFDVNVYGNSGQQDYGIGLCICVSIDENNINIEHFEEEMERLSRVETFERVPYQRID